MPFLRRAEATADVATVEPLPTPPPIRLVAAPDQRSAGLCADLASRLPRAASGVAFVYEALEQTARAFGLEDCVLILDDARAGRQVFRLGRRPVEAIWSAPLVQRGAPGLHTRPGGVDPDLAEGLVGLATVALRGDVLAHDALHDPLTGLSNRRAFDEQLVAMAARSQRYGWPFSLVLLDLDGFKAVNDQFGHLVGDRCLRTVGDELRRNLRHGDVAARVGGDEFALMLASAGPDIVPVLQQRLEEAVARSVPQAGVGLSIGAASAPADATDPVALFRLADNRLYEAKRS